MGFTKSRPARTGRPAYPPKALLGQKRFCQFGERFCPAVITEINFANNRVVAKQKARLTHTITMCIISLVGPVAQLVRVPACHAGGRGFEPLLVRFYKNAPVMGRFFDFFGKDFVIIMPSKALENNVILCIIHKEAFA